MQKLSNADTKSGIGVPERAIAVRRTDELLPEQSPGWHRKSAGFHCGNLDRNRDAQHLDDEVTPGTGQLAINLLLLIITTGFAFSG